MARFPEIVRFEADRSVVKAGETVSLRYEVKDADSVTIRPDVVTAVPVLMGEVTTAPLEETTIFEIEAVSEAGLTMQRLTVTVGTPEQVDIRSFTADPEMAVVGQEVTLRWETVLADSVRLGIAGGPTILPAAMASGEHVVTPVESTIYELRAEGPSGPAVRVVEVRVSKGPSVVSFGASPESINPGESATLSWQTENATRVVIADDAGTTLYDGADASSEIEVSPITETVYTLTASSDVGSAEGRTTVTVIGAERPTINQFGLSPSTLTGPGEVTATWTVTDGDAVTLLVDGQRDSTFPGTQMGTHALQMTQTASVTLVATNMFGETRATELVTVLPPTDNTPPTIEHTPVSTDQPEGAAVQIAARVTDDVAGVDEVRVYYRAAGGTTFQSALLVSDGSGNWTGSIPGAQVSAPAVEYYLEASDLAPTPNVGVDPVGAPTTLHGFTVVPLDNQPPVITHTPVVNGRLANTAVTIECEVVDASSGIGGVTLYFRPTGGGTFTARAMTLTTGNTYAAQLTAGEVLVPGVDYYIQAEDGATPANVVTQPPGAPTQRHSFTVSPQDMSPPTITHTAIANGQTAGGAILVSAIVADESGVGTVSLFYRTQGQPTFTSATMVAVSGSYRATIPATAVQPPGVDYYIRAQDTSLGQNAGNLPAGAPGAPFSFTAVMLDSNPPTITHTPVVSPSTPGQSVTVQAQINDASGLAQANLHYRRIGQTSFTTIAMTGGPTYSAVIPANVVEPPGVEYYLEATDLAQPPNAGREPTNAPTTLHAFQAGVGESEPNGAAAQAAPLLTAGRVNNVGVGAISPTGDRDWWFIDVPTNTRGYNLRLAVTSGGVSSCPAPTNPVLTLLAGDGTTQLATDSFDGVGNCPSLAPETDPGTVSLAPGRYYVRVEESGNNAVIGAYELRAELTLTACGNGILETADGEQCEDGGTQAGDGCSATCTIEPDATFSAPGGAATGDLNPATEVDIFAVDVTGGQFIFAEIDDGAGGCPGDTVLELLDTDGVTLLGSDNDDGSGACSEIDPLRDVFAGNLAAGRYFLRVRAFLPSTPINGYRLSLTVSNNVCGNGATEGAEQCDDGNRTAFDGCSDVCAWETAGVATGGGASFTGAINPVGNIDWYEVVVNAGESIRAETFIPTTGECATGDTVIRLFAADRQTELVSDDQGGIASCSRLDPGTDVEVRSLAAGTYYVTVEDWNNNGTIPAYTLDIVITGAGCGNGFLEGAETCDDGNTQGGDGCSAMCTIEGTPEAEPNDTWQQASALLTAGNNEATTLGVVANSQDVDIYSVVVPAGSHLIAEVSDVDGRCSNDADLRLRDTNGTTSLIFDSSDGPGSCGRLAPGSDTQVRDLNAGTYYLEVSGDGAASVYQLSVRVAPANSCGNLTREGVEQCDDGNTTSGDGCSATCTFELAEVEGNDDFTTATALAGTTMVRGSLTSTTTPSDADDWYQVTVPIGGSLTIRTHDGARDQCSMDTVVELFESDGTTMVTSDDDDGVGLCSTVEWFEAADLTMGSYYIRVRPYSSTSWSFAYALSVSISP